MSLSVAGFSAGMTNSSEVAASSTVDFEQPDSVQEGVILHCWNWSYNNIKSIFRRLLQQATPQCRPPVTQPKDYYWEGTATAMSESPTAQAEHGNWWKAITCTNQSATTVTHGTAKAEFKAMCDEAEKYGIKVIVDISNHMGNIQGWKIGSVEEVMGDISPQVGTF